MWVEPVNTILTKMVFTNADGLKLYCIVFSKWIVFSS